MKLLTAFSVHKKKTQINWGGGKAEYFFLITFMTKTKQNKKTWDAQYKRTKGKKKKIFKDFIQPSSSVFLPLTDFDWKFLFGYFPSSRISETKMILKYQIKKYLQYEAS